MAVANGAGVIVPAMDVPVQGTMAVITDTGGAAIGIWQPAAHQGFGVLGEPGAPSWFELHRATTTPRCGSTATCSAGTPTP